MSAGGAVGGKLNPPFHGKIGGKNCGLRCCKRKSSGAGGKIVAQSLIENGTSSLLAMVRRYRPPKQLLEVEDWPGLALSCRYRVREVARRCGVSVGQLRSFCEQLLKMPPKPWLQELRLAQAREWIARGRSTAAVARALFFRDAPHFCREFKQAQGFSPQLWRRRWFTAGPQRPYGPGRRPVWREQAHPAETEFPWLVRVEWR
jgi:AraC-like DNA-binding protein